MTAEVTRTDTGHAAEADAVASFHPYDLNYPGHLPDYLVIGGTEGGTVKVCRVCGRFPNGVVWGRAPGQPSPGPDAERIYRREQTR